MRIYFFTNFQIFFMFFWIFFILARWYFKWYTLSTDNNIYFQISLGFFSAYIFILNSLKKNIIIDGKYYNMSNFESLELLIKNKISLFKIYKKEDKKEKKIILSEIIIYN